MRLTAVIAFLFVAIAAWGSSPVDALESPGPDSTVVTLRGMLSRYELWPAMYSWAEQTAAENGGMKMHAYMLDHAADWVALRVAGDGVWPPGVCVTLEFDDGRRAESVDLVATDSPVELRVYDLSCGFNFARTDVGRAKSGGVLIMAAFLEGSLGATHGEYWADLPGLARMEVSVP